MAIVMLSAGLLSLAFMGFSGVDGGLRLLFGLDWFIRFSLYWEVCQSHCHASIFFAPFHSYIVGLSPFQFPCSSHFVPSSPAWFWDLMRIHWWLTEELPTSVCGRNVQCDEWFSLEPRCKDSANRVECKRETRFSFHFRGAAYLGRQCKGTKKSNRFTHLSPTCDRNVLQYYSFWKANFIVLIRQIFPKIFMVLFL